MSWVATAVVGSTVIGAVTSKKAGKAAAQGDAAAIEEQRRQFDQLRADQAPYRELGGAALSDINSLYRGGAGGTPDMSRFFTSPDYKFNLEQTQQGIDRSMLARGRGLSGAAVKEGARYASGLASGEFGNYMNRLYAQAGIGQSANNFTGQAGMNTAANVGGHMQAAGNARASGYQGVGDALQGGASNFLLMQYLRPGSGGGFNPSPGGLF